MSFCRVVSCRVVHLLSCSGCISLALIVSQNEWCHTVCPLSWCCHAVVFFCQSKWCPFAKWCHAMLCICSAAQAALAWLSLCRRMSGVILCVLFHGVVMPWCPFAKVSVVLLPKQRVVHLLSCSGCSRLELIVAQNESAAQLLETHTRARHPGAHFSEQQRPCAPCSKC